jgi:hypothetical protein
MILFLFTGGFVMKVLVASREAGVIRRLTGDLRTLLVPHQVVRSEALHRSIATPNTVFCVDSRVAVEMPDLSRPIIIILSGALVSDELIARMSGGRVCTLRLSEMTPATLLRAMVSVTIRHDFKSLAERLQRLGRFRHVSAALITAFLEEPAQMNRLTDLRHSLAPLSREAAQAMVRSGGFKRAEHLFTALRSATWTLLTTEGVDRYRVEEYLGIGDRSSFRRACRRARVPALRRGLRAEMFEDQGSGR